jgi:putative nucleotidyltransferase-like protein
LPRTAWPDAAGLDALRLALLEGKAVHEAWARLAERGDEVPPRLRPLAAWNLTRAGIEPPEIFRAETREAWVASQRLLDLALPLVSDLRTAGVEVLLIKGAGLASSVYPQPALRPMGDLDLLIGPPGMDTARRVLASAGFRPVGETANPNLHSFGYEHADGLQVDLHAYALLENVTPGADGGFFRRARLLPSSRVDARTLSAEDHFLLICAHGLRWSSTVPIYWVADAVMLLRSAGATFDWRAVAAEAESRKLSHVLWRAAALLRTQFAATVPDSALDRLFRGGRGLRLRLEHAARLRQPSLTRGIFLHWCALARRDDGLSLLRRGARFPAFLRDAWGLATIGEVPRAALQKSAARLRAGRHAG